MIKLTEFVSVERKPNMSEFVKRKNFLAAGGIMSALISLLHFILALKPEFYRYITAGRESELARMAESGSTATSIGTISLGILFAIWAIYAFSGAGLIRRLPLIRMVLVIIAFIYILRALFLFTEINMVLDEGYPFRFVVFSAISLAAGALYLAGILKKGEQS